MQVMLDLDDRLINLRKHVIILKLPRGGDLLWDTEYEHIVQLPYEIRLAKYQKQNLNNEHEKNQYWEITVGFKNI